MVVETAKNQIILNQIVGQKKESRLVETDVIVNDVKPDVLNVISTFRMTLFSAITAERSRWPRRSAAVRMIPDPRTAAGNHGPLR